MITQSIAMFIVETHDRSDLWKTVDGKWSWTKTDPFAVVVTFPGGELWTFAADLVIEGVKAPAGLADVKIWPSGDEHCRMRLESPDGYVTFEMEREPLRYFASRIIKAAPAQRAPSDDEINRYLDEWSRS